MKKWKIIAALLAASGALALTGCESTPSTLKSDEEQTATQLARYQKNQPVPQYDWSQYRQTLIDIQSAQVHGVATTSFFFNMGVANPIKSCPSIGFPIPTTAQLTNPEQTVYDYRDSPVLPLMEASGVYTGDSSGTYAICVADDGTAYASYWEGFIQTEGGPAHWDPVQQTIVLDGPPTVETTSE